MQPVIATWIVLDSADEQSYYPQTGYASSADPRVHDMYWNCVSTFFASAFLRAGKDTRLVLYTNTSYLPTRVKELFEYCNVSVEQVPLSHLAPEGYFGMWRNQFYILDIILHIAQAQKPPSTLILDSDCLFTRDLQSLWSALADNDILSYKLLTKLDEDINGLTRLDMQKLFQSLSGDSSLGIPEYYGGEFFAATGNQIREFARISPEVWSQNLSLFDQGRPKLNEEAHFLSYLYTVLKLRNGNADRFIRRIWTQRRLRDGTESDLLLSIWHVPAEKRFGFKRLAPYVYNRKSWFWREGDLDSWRSRLASIMGIPRPSAWKKAADLTISVRDKIAQLRGKG